MTAIHVDTAGLSSAPEGIPGSPARAMRNLTLSALGLASTVILFPGLRVFAINHVYFDVSLAHAAGWLAAATLLLTLAVIGPVVVLPRRRYDLYSALVLGAAYFAWLKVSFLGWDYGTFAGVGIDWSLYNRVAYVDLVVFTFIFLFVVRARRRLVSRSGTLIAFLLMVQPASLLLTTPLAKSSGREAIMAKRTVQLLERDREKLSRTSNVIILVVDTLQSDVVRELLSANPQWRTRLRGFTFFRDTASASALTIESVPNALTGTLFDNQIPYARYLQSVYETRGSALKNLREAGFYVELAPWGHATPIPLESTFISNIGEPSFQPDLEVLRSILAAATFTVMPQFVQRPMYPYVLAIMSNYFDSRAGSNLRFIRDTEHLPIEFIDQPVAKFIHVRGPHAPLLGYGEHGFDYFSASQADRLDAPFELPYTRENYTRVAQEMLDAVMRYLSKLDRAGVYDDSAIFIIGDHGAGRLGLSFREPDLPATTTQGAAASSQLQAGAAATLLAKAPGVHRALVTSDAPVALSDVACTLNTSIVRISNGECPSLFADVQTDTRRRVYVDFLNTRFDASGYFPPMTEYAIEGPMWQVSSWRRTGRILLGGSIRNDSVESRETW